MAASVVRLEALPLVDLRLLSQPEVYSLVLCSSSNSSFFPSSYGNDDILIPKIDRSVFNESAGSHKQTYSRPRLAPRKPQSPTRSSFSSTPRQIPEPLDEENSQIISLLKQLFAAETSPSTDEDGLVPVPVELEEFLPDSSSAGPAGLQIFPVDVASSGHEEETRKRGRPPKNENRMTERNVECKAEPSIPINVVAGEGEKKQKQGRPRKNENLLTESYQSERAMAAVYKSAGKKQKEMEVVVVNKKGDVTGVAALGNVEDPYGEELKRRTEGFQTEADFLGFLSGLRGKWWRKSRQKRIVMASDFGHALPNG